MSWNSPAPFVPIVKEPMLVHGPATKVARSMFQVAPDGPAATKLTFEDPKVGGRNAIWAGVAGEIKGRKDRPLYPLYLSELSWACAGPTETL